MKQESKRTMKAGLVGFATGLIVSSAASILEGPGVDSVQMYRDGQGASVLKLEAVGRRYNQILVETRDGDSVGYVPLKTHLEGFEDRGEMELEEARLKKVARWYDER